MNKCIEEVQGGKNHLIDALKRTFECDGKNSFRA